MGAEYCSSSHQIKGTSPGAYTLPILLLGYHRYDEIANNLSPIYPDIMADSTRVIDLLLPILEGKDLVEWVEEGSMSWTWDIQRQKLILLRVSLSW